MEKEHYTNYIQELYVKYSDELKVLSEISKTIYDKMIASGQGATFCDVESELLYLLIREQRPKVIFEISPDCGYSTHYILQAITKNQSGILYSFELSETIHGRLTYDVIRSNQHKASDLSRLKLIIGDARIECAKLLKKPDFIFLDSCHEDFFAEWYMKFLLPKCCGTALIHDVMYHKGVPELSTESSYLQSATLNLPCDLIPISDIGISLSDLREKIGIVDRSPFVSISAWVPDCSPFKKLSALDLSGTFQDMLQSSKHAQTIQGNQFSPWKNRSEIVAEPYESAENIRKSNGDTAAWINTMFSITPLTAIDQIKDKPSVVNRVVTEKNISILLGNRDIYPLCRIFSKANRLRTDSFINLQNLPTGPVNIIEACSLLSIIPQVAGHIDFDALIKDPKNITYWKLQLIQLSSEKKDWKYKKLKGLLPEIKQSNILNKRTALEIAQGSPYYRDIFSELKDSLLNFYPRNQMAYRHLYALSKLCPSYEKRVKKLLQEAAESTSIKTLKASTEIMVSYLVDFKISKAVSMYLRIRNNINKNLHGFNSSGFRYYFQYVMRVTLLFKMSKIVPMDIKVLLKDTYKKFNRLEFS